MTEPFISEIDLFSFNFAPAGWAACNGQLLPINQNQALFSLLGTTYGGDGRTTFALPDLRGRVPMGVGGGHALGEKLGSETIVLDATQMPAHTHTINGSGLTATAKCRSGAANQQSPLAGVPATEATNVTAVYGSAAPDSDMKTGAIAVGGSLTTTNAGGAVGHENRQPYLALMYCIALTGIFPSQQ
jgi:microcystin-dependent protein